MVPMPLVYLPDVESLFLWGSEPVPLELPALGQSGEPSSTTLLAPEGLRETACLELPLFDTMAKLAVVPAAELESLPSSVATWVLASKLAMVLARERVVPIITRRAGRIEARWAAALASSEDAAKVAALAKGMPPAAHAVPAVGDHSGAVWAPDALVRAYLDAVVDALVRAGRGGPSLPPARANASRATPSSWADRWRAALGGVQRSFETDGFAERSVVDELARWSKPALGARDRLAEAGFGVIVPGELTAAGQRRLRLRMRVGGGGKKVAGVVAGTGLADVMSDLGLTDRKHFRTHYWKPAIEQGLIEMTLPDKPRSSKQRYRLTELGRRMKGRRARSRPS